MTNRFSILIAGRSATGRLLIRACCLGVAILTAQATPAWSQDGIFSAVRPGTVFSPTAKAPQTEKSPIAPDAAPHTLGLKHDASLENEAERLTAALALAGYLPSKLSDQAVSITYPVGNRSVQVMVAASDEKSLLKLVMVLVPKTELPSDLTGMFPKLLAANAEHSPAWFAFNQQRQRVELHYATSVDGISRRVLEFELQALADVATKTADLWGSAGGSTGATDTVAAASAASKAVTMDSLVGKWSCALTDSEAFALLLKVDGAFLLVHVANGRQNRSAGKAALDSETLTFTGDDGNSLAGSVEMKSANEFRFAPRQTGKHLVFKRVE